MIRIMIIEDEGLTGVNTGSNIKMAGCDIVSIIRSNEIDSPLIYDAHPDVILMNMSKGGNIDLFDTLGEISSQNGIPVIVLAAEIDDELLNCFYKGMHVGFVRKPLNDKEILLAVKNALKGVSIINEYKCAQMALNESKDMLDIINKLSSDCFYSLRVNKSGEFLIDWIKGGFEHLTGYTQNEIKDIGTWSSLIYPDDFPLYERSVREVLGNRETSIEYRIIKKTGEVCFIRNRQFPLWAKEQGRVTRVLGAFSDISKQMGTCFLPKRDVPMIEEITSDAGTTTDINRKTDYIGQLSSNVDEMHMLIDHSEVILVKLDTDGNLIRINRKGCEILGYSVDEVLGKNWFREFLYGDNKMAFEKSFRLLLEGEDECIEQEVPVLTGRGQIRFIKWHSMAIKGEDGVIIGVFCSGEDMTECRYVEENLRKMLVRFKKKVFETEAFLDAARAVLEEKDFSITARRIFDSCKRMTGATAGYVAVLSHDSSENELLFLDPGGLQCTVDPSLPMPVRGLWAEAYNAGETVYENDFHNSEWMEFIPDGHVMLENCLFAPLKLNGKTVGLIGLANKQGGFSDKDKELSSAFAEIAEIALLNSRTRGELKESEERFRRLAENAKDIIFRLSLLDMHFEYISPASYDTLGYSPDELYNDPSIFEGLIHPDSIKDFKEQWARILKGDMLPYYEYKIIHKSGEVRWIYHRSVLIRDNSETPIAIEGIITDITEIKRVEEALSTSNKKYQALQSQASDAILITDFDGQLLEWNEKAENLFALSRDKIQGMNIVDFFKDDEKSRAKAALSGCLIKGVFRLLDTSMLKGDGSSFPADISGTIIKYGQKRLMQAIVRDMTLKHEIEQEMLKVQKLESIGLLAGGIAHDFNNILTPITGNISLAKMNFSPGDTIYEILSEAEKAIKQARTLTQQLLTFAKGGAPVKRIISIKELIKESASFTLRGSNVKSIFSIPDDLWEVEIDEGQINQVLQNLILNADQAMPSGGRIYIEAENVIIEKGDIRPLKEGRYVKLSIRDCGVGIPKEYLTKIFDPYFTTKQRGNGLGLTVCYSIIKKHGGHIDLETEQGEGTIFHIYIPASERIMLRKTVMYKTAIQGTGRVLIMDDEEIVRNILERMVKALGYIAESADDGVKAIELYKQAKKTGDPFDVVIMDITIPGGLGGKETIKILHEFDPQVRAIVSSGYSNDPILARYHSFGFKGGISKPYDINELSEILHRVMG